MPRVNTKDLKRAYEVLCEHLENEAREPEIERVADWLISQIETRNIRGVAREHGKTLGEMRKLVAEAEARDCH
jgi:hypothetical protein